MFTGIIETTSAVLNKTEKTFTIERPDIFFDIEIGQSIAVNGACLSVSKYTEKTISFDVLSETLRKTNLGETQSVNLERAMPANGRFEGHIVLGHVDRTLQLREKKQENSGIEYVFTLPKSKKERQFFVSKGSIALNGVSLTLGNISLSLNTFSVFLIPLTLQHTNLKTVQEGENITVEYDYLAKFMMNKI